MIEDEVLDWLKEKRVDSQTSVHFSNSKMFLEANLVKMHVSWSDTHGYQKNVFRG